MTDIERDDDCKPVEHPHSDQRNWRPEDDTPSPVSRRVQAWKLLAQGGICHHCERKLIDGEPIWRARVYFSYGNFQGRSLLATICERCRVKRGDQHTTMVWSEGPCDGCGRMVHETERRYGGRRHHYCCESCKRKDASTRGSAVARQRRADVRGPSRPCAECGEHFEPKRADAQFCSSACRQKAYRKRVTVTANELSVQNDDSLSVTPIRRPPNKAPIF